MPSLTSCLIGLSGSSLEICISCHHSCSLPSYSSLNGNSNSSCYSASVNSNGNGCSRVRPPTEFNDLLQTCYSSNGGFLQPCAMYFAVNRHTEEHRGTQRWLLRSVQYRCDVGAYSAVRPFLRCKLETSCCSPWIWFWCRYSGISKDKGWILCRRGSMMSHRRLSLPAVSDHYHRVNLVAQLSYHPYWQIMYEIVDFIVSNRCHIIFHGHFIVNSTLPRLAAG